MLRKVKLAPKLIGAFVLVATFVVIAGIVGLTSLRNVGHNADVILDQQVPVADATMQLQLAITRARDLMAEYLLENDPAQLPQIKQEFAQQMAEYDDLSDVLLKGGKIGEVQVAAADDKKLREFVTQADGVHAEFQAAASEMMENHRKALARQATTLVAEEKDARAEMERVDETSANAVSLLAQADGQAAKGMSGAMEKADAAQARATMIVWGVTILGFLVAAALGLIFSRSISAPMQKAVHMIREMGQGHLGERLELEREDEVGELATSMDQLAEDLQVHVIGSMQRLAKGDVDVQIPVKDADDEIGPAINGTAGALQKLIAEMNHMSNEHDAGDIDVQIPAEDFEGAYAEVAQGVNDMVNGHITVKKKAMACVEQFGKGNFDAELEQFPGKKAFINDVIEEVRDNLKGVASEIRGLSQGVENGDLSVRGEDGNFEGDWEALIGGLNRLVEAFVDPLEEAAEVLEAAADRDLTRRVEGDYAGDLREFTDNINRALKSMDESLGQVAAAVVQVAEASGQISSGSQQLAEGSAEQASSLQEVSSSLEELGAMTRQNAGNAGEARNLSNEAAESAATGDEAMGRMSEAMDRIQNSSEETAKIVNTIDEIAFQTNLLALNAAVEAARAGDAGKGFAVVAEEGRNLAQRSAEAAKDTADMIEDAVKNAEGGVEISQEVAEALTEIASGATNVNELVAEIAAASDEQAQGLEQINTAVGEMDSVTQNNAANSEESASAAEELSAQAQELRGMVEGFRLTSANASGGSGASAASLSLVDEDGEQATAQPKSPDRAIPLDDEDEDIAALSSF